MSIEDDLLNMFQYVDIGKGQSVNALLETLVRNAQINALKVLRQQLDSNIKKLQEAAPAGVKANVNLDPYEILGVKQSATRVEIDKAFKKKAWITHPDHGGSTEEFIKVAAAYEAIKQLRGWK